MDKNVQNAAVTKSGNMKYPKGVYYILPFYCLERLVYYGLLGGAVLYLQQRLGYTAPDASSIIALLMSLSYFTPVLGALIADVWLGKVRTVLTFCCFLCGGSILFTTSAATTTAITGVLGLLILGLSSGLIKAIIYSLGGDQFKLPEQNQQQFRYFSAFVWIRCLGYFLGITLMSELRDSVQCFGDDCYLLPFSILTGCIIVGAWLFYLGRHFYIENAPTDNTLIESAQCIFHAIKHSLTRGAQKKNHFLDHAGERYSNSLIDDIKRTFKVLTVFSTFPLCWTLINQSFIGMVFLAKRLNKSFGSFELPPELIVALSPLLSLILIPITRIHWLIKTPPMRTATSRIMTAMVCLFLSYISYAMLNMAVEQNAIPENKAQIMFYNTQECPAEILFSTGNTMIVHPKSQLSYSDFDKLSNNSCSFNIQCEFGISKTNIIDINTSGGKVSVIVLLENKTLSMDPTDEYLKDSDADAKVRVIYVKSRFNEVYLKHKDFELPLESQLPNNASFIKIKPKAYEIFYSKTKIGSVVIQQDGVYDIVANGNDITVFNMTSPSSVHVSWMIPQYLLLTFGEIMITVDTMDFAYSEAPVQMKALLQAAQLFTQSIGFWILAGLTKLFSLSDMFNHKQSYQTIIYAFLIAANTVVYKILLKRYQRYKSKCNMNNGKYSDNI